MNIKMIMKTKMARVNSVFEISAANSKKQNLANVFYDFYHLNLRFSIVKNSEFQFVAQFNSKRIIIKTEQKYFTQMYSL